jgi:hypothetical protein
MRAERPRFKGKKGLALTAPSRRGSRLTVLPRSPLGRAPLWGLKVEHGASSGRAMPPDPCL